MLQQGNLKNAYLELGYSGKDEQRSVSTKLKLGYHVNAYQRLKPVDEAILNQEIAIAKFNINNYLVPKLLASRQIPLQNNSAVNLPYNLTLNPIYERKGFMGSKKELEITVCQTDNLASRRRKTITQELRAIVKYSPDKTEIEYVGGNQRCNQSVIDILELCLFGRESQ